MSEILVHVRRYLSEGLQVVPLRDGKTCVEKEWPTRIFTDADFTPDVLGVGVKSIAGRRIIDNDCAKLGPACLRLLPATRVDGRPGKAPGHFEYVLTDDLPPFQFRDVDDSVIIEILGTQAAMPPSPTAYGPRSFVEDRAVATSSAAVVGPLVKLLASIGLVINHWPSHGRHNLLNALAGFFARVGVPEDDALAALEEITRAAEGQVWNDCRSSVRNSYQKHESGAATTGGPAIANILGSDVAARLRSWWINRVEDQVVEALNDQHFVASVGSQETIGCEDRDNVTFKTERSMRLRYANKKVAVGKTEKGKLILKCKFDIWKEHPRRREYRMVTFAPPPFPCDQRDFNLWRGWGVRPMRPAPGDPARNSKEALLEWVEQHARPKCQLFLDLTRNAICAGNEEHFRFLIDHLAKTAQFPGEVGGVAIVMKGDRGAGKGRFVNYFGGLFGTHFTRISKREQILGQFNAAIADKVVVFADEAFYAGDKASLGALKTLITEETLQIEKKFIDAIEVPNFTHLFQATNEDWHTPAGFEERRFLALNVSPTYKGQFDFFAKLEAEKHNGGAEALLAYLLSRPLTAVRLRELRLPPRTDELRRQVEFTMPAEQQWWKQRLNDGRITQFASESWPARITTDELHADYLRYCDDLKIYGRRIDRDHFKTTVLDQVLTDSDRERGGLRRRTWKLARLGEARRLFDEKQGMPTAWPAEEREPLAVGRPDDQQPTLPDVPDYLREVHDVVE